jgi:cell division protein FtsA
MIPKNFYSAIIDTFEKVWLHVVDIIPNIVSATEVVLDYDHRDLWCILIDIGKNQTSYVIYEDGYPLGYWIIPLWSEDVTKDISIWMQVDIKEAETIKKSHWTALLENKQASNDTSLDIHFLSDIINARYEEIFLKINKQLKKLDKDRRLPGWVLLIGGGARMPNIDLLSKDVFKLATFFGKDNILNLWDLSTNLQFINVLGTYVWSNKYIEWRKTNFKMNLDFLWNIGNFFKELF